MSFRRTFCLRQCLPDRHHMFGRLHRKFVKQTSKCVHTLDRMANRDIDEKKNPIKNLAADIERFGRCYNRFAKLVVGEPVGLRPRNL